MAVTGCASTCSWTIISSQPTVSSWARTGVTPTPTRSFCIAKETTTMRKLALAIGGAVVLLGAAIGLSYAQSAPTAKDQHQAVIDDAAAKLGISGTDLAQALKEARKELGTRVQLGKLVKDELTVAAKTVGLADAKALRQELRGSTLTAVA